MAPPIRVRRPTCERERVRPRARPTRASCEGTSPRGPPQRARRVCEEESSCAKSGRRHALSLCVFSSLFPQVLWGVRSERTLAAPVGSLRAPTARERAAIKDGLSQVSKGKAPVLLRLVFHDAGTFDRETGRGGPNGSVRFELDRPESRGLKRGLKVVGDVKESIAAKGKVDLSYADLIVVLGAWAVEVCGGPRMDVLIGRVDASEPDAENMIPDENLPAQGIKESFARMGLDTLDLVALSGSHALGGKGYGDPLTFDNVYYKTLLEKPWLSQDSMKQMIGIPSDRVLPGESPKGNSRRQQTISLYLHRALTAFLTTSALDDLECRPIIEKYASSQAAFFADFASSYAKITTLGYSS